MAVQQGRADESIVKAGIEPIELQKGRELYEAHIKRPPALGGASKKTQVRYKAVFDKLLPNLASRGIRYWNGVDRRAVEDYLRWLDENDYASASVYLEATTIKQTLKFLVREKLLPESSLLHLTVSRPRSTSRYCWRAEEVDAMLQHCFADPKLHWLGYVLLGLATTGLRIGELANLRWSDFDLDAGILRLPDRHLHAVKSRRNQARSTKGKRDRSFPIHPDLRAVLERLSHHPDGFVFRAAGGGRLDDDKVRISLIRDVQTPLAARFPAPADPDEPGFADGTPHSFRHYFASAAAHLNLPERLVQAWLGHQDSKMVSWYFHLHSDESKTQMTKLSEIAGSSDAAWRRSLPPVDNRSAPKQMVKTEMKRVVVRSGRSEAPR
jgi:integrase